MSETVLKVGVDELGVLRVECVHCGVATEIPLARLARALADGVCPTCKKDLLPIDASARQVVLRQLAQVLAELAGAKDDARITSLYGPREPGMPPPSLGDKLFAFGPLLVVTVVRGFLVANC